MKKVLIVSLMLSLFTLAFSIVMSVADPLKTGVPPTDTSSAASDMPTSAPPATGSSPPTSPVPSAEYVFTDDQITVRVSTDGHVTNMTMRQYLVGVVAAEMPASFNMEALKAQAVAARTETLYHIMLFKSDCHPDADVCSDPACCQAYKNDDELIEKWGEVYGEYIDKITEAVESTDGECLTFENAPIQAVFHSSSAGQTADSGEVWAYSLPYLISVQSPETAADVPNYVSSVTVSLSDFKETVIRFYPSAVFPKDKSKWVTDITYTDSKRISALKLGGVTVTGTALRSMFGLRSTAASIKLNDKNVIFTTTGYGHGVGMSQYGANAFASEGKTYKEILSWYYAGVTFSNEKDLVIN
jgi:stage II sporulation protein D